VSVEEAIAAYTLSGARLSFEEGEKGALSVGSLADLAVLDRDPRRDPGRLAERRVERTFVGGRLVYEREAEQ
jgi:predicted amidohydrolase YtcJ